MAANNQEFFEDSVLFPSYRSVDYVVTRIRMVGMESQMVQNSRGVLQSQSIFQTDQSGENQHLRYIPPRSTPTMTFNFNGK